VPLGGQRPRPSPVFACMRPFGRGPLAVALAQWWRGKVRRGTVTVHRRLQVQPPQGDPVTGWRMQGRVRRLTNLHWVPVVIELWPVYDGFVRITMTPQAHVYASRRYYRLGQSVLDRLWSELTAA
jgi:hypothetical protein